MDSGSDADVGGFDEAPVCELRKAGRKSYADKTAGSFDELTCCACGNPCPDTQQFYRGLPIHSTPCQTGLRSYLRTIADWPDALAEEKNNFCVAPLVWRKALDPFVHGGSRKAAIEDTRLKMKETYEANEKVEDDFELDRAQFHDHKKKHAVALDESFDSDDCNLSFDALYRQQGSK